jgi:hypothetical protein
VLEEDCRPDLHRNCITLRSHRTTVRRSNTNFGSLGGPTYKGIQSPLWLPNLSLGFVAGIPWAYKLRRFSLRTLLIGMTMVAVALDLIFAMSR